MIPYSRPCTHLYGSYMALPPPPPAGEKSLDNKSIREQNVRIAYMKSLRERCLFLTCKCNPSKGVWHPSERGALRGRTTTPPPPRPPRPCTDQKERGAFVAHAPAPSSYVLLYVLLAMLVALLSRPTPSFPFLSADSGRSTVS